jgi:hypothetical protein
LVFGTNGRGFESLWARKYTSGNLLILITGTFLRVLNMVHPALMAFTASGVEVAARLLYTPSMPPHRSRDS